MGALVTVSGRFELPNNVAPPPGGIMHWLLTPGHIPDTAEPVTVVGGPVVVPIGSDGSFMVTLRATDDPDLIAHVDGELVYKVTVCNNGTRVFWVTVPSPGPWDWSELSPTVESDAIVTPIPGPVGPQGPQGPMGPQGPAGSGTLLAASNAETIAGIAVDRAVTPASLDYWENTSIDVMHKGAVNDYSADASPAFNTAFDEVRTTRVDNTSLGASVFPNTLRHSQRVINIPAGTYLVTDPGALLDSQSGEVSRTSGLLYQGAGLGVTNIIFAPVSPPSEVFLIENNDHFLNVTFKDMSFFCSTANCSFMDSNSAGGPMGYRFENVEWNGTWKRGLLLRGSNTNSEFRWVSCHIGGTWETFLELGPDDNSGNDQHLNYEFISPTICMAAGTLVKAVRGGDISVYGGSLIHTSSTVVDQTWFDLRRTAGATNANGVLRLGVHGTRFELKNTGSKLIQTNWGNGTINIVNCDFSSQLSFVPLASHTSAIFDMSLQGAIVTWRDCALMGQHHYQYNNGTSWDAPHRIHYENCTFPGEVAASLFVETVPGFSGANHGGRPLIDIENCRVAGTTGRTNVIDTVFNWHQSRVAPAKHRYLNVLNANGQLPIQGSSTVVKIPLNAIIVGFHASKLAGGTATGTTFTYTFTNGDSTVYATLDGGGAAWNTAWEDHERDKWFVCDTDNKRTITIVAANIAELRAGYLVLEYIA